MSSKTIWDIAVTMEYFMFQVKFPNYENYCYMPRCLVFPKCTLTENGYPIPTINFSIYYYYEEQSLSKYYKHNCIVWDEKNV